MNTTLHNSFSSNPRLFPLREWNRQRPSYLRTTQLQTSTTKLGFSNDNEPGSIIRRIRRAKTQTFHWNTKIKQHVDNNRYEEAMDCYYLMQELGVKANHFTFPFVIKACTCTSSFSEAVKLHGRMVKTGFDSDCYVCNSLLAMYSKLGFIDLAKKMFDEMPNKNQVSWNSMINGLVSAGDCHKALVSFHEMQQILGMEADRFSVMAVLDACSSEKWWKLGKEIHCYVLRHGLELDVAVQASILDMYCKCNDMVSAEKVFGFINLRSVVSWNVLIGGYSINGRPKEAFAYLIRMREEDITPDHVTLINLLPCCAQLRQGRALHGVAISEGLLPHVKLDTALVDMYAKFGKLRPAEILFDQMDERSMITWNTMITAYVQNVRNVEAIKFFIKLLMGSHGVDTFTVSAVLSAYTELGLLRHARQIHVLALKFGYDSITLISNSITYMYARCGDLPSARRIFDATLHKDLVSWNTVIMAHAIHGQAGTALELLSEMETKWFSPNHSTLVSVLSACITSGLVDEGRKYFDSMQHVYNIDPGMEHYSCMVDLLGREGNLQEAEDFIKQMPIVPTARIWGSLLRASRNCNNLGFAEVAAKHIFELEQDNTGCFIVLTNMYADAGRWDEVERLRGFMNEKGLQKLTVRSVVELGSQTFSFQNSDRSHPEINKICKLSDFFSDQIGEEVSASSSMSKLHEVLARKACLPSRHSARLAVCCGLISSAVGRPVLVKKNVRICNSCHDAIKSISRISRRYIVVGDSRIFHHFRNGTCSCGDYW